MLSSRRQAEEIAAERVAGAFRVSPGIECDILPDGALDLPDDVLAQLEWVQAMFSTAGSACPAGR